MDKCLICNKEFDSLKHLSAHLKFVENIDAKTYFDKYIYSLIFYESKSEVNYDL